MFSHVFAVETENGQEVLLRIEFDALVGLAVHVDGQAGNGEDRSFEVDEVPLGPEGVLRFDGDGTGQGQGAVEPRFAQEAAVDFRR